MGGSVSTQIYNATTSTNSLNVSNQFSAASFVYAIAPDTTDDYEVDIHLNIQLGLEVKRVPLDKIFIRTNNVITIPSEYRSCGLSMRIIMITDEPVKIELYAVECYCCGKEELDEILLKLTFNDVKQNLLLTNQLLQDYAISALATSLGASLAVVSAGVSASIPGTVLPILAPAQAYLPVAGVLTGFP